MIIFMRHPEHGVTEVYDTGTRDRNKKNGWYEIDGPHGGIPEAPKVEAATVDTAEDERESLMEQAEAQGIDVDRRWGLERLRREILKKG